MSNRNWAIVPVWVALAAAMLLVPRVAAGQEQGGFKLEGVWVARASSMEGVPTGTPLPFQWNYVLVPSASGRRASLHGSVVVAFPQVITSDFVSPLIGEVIQTGPDTFAFTTIWHHVRTGSPANQVVLIGMARGEARFIESGKLEATHHFALYLPSADADGDGLPEGVPFMTFEVTSVDTRVPLGF
jgi:hypothetical protein